jgi:tetratricopeptide (TPR) repeat protein
MNEKCSKLLEKAVHAQTAVDAPPAEELFQAALDEDPAAWEVYYHRGIYHYHLDRYTEALVNITSAISLLEEGKNPLFAELYTLRGICYRFLYQPGPALADVNRALRLNNNLHTALLERGFLNYLLKNDEEAEVDLLTVKELDISSNDFEKDEIGPNNSYIGDIDIYDTAGDNNRTLKEQATVYLACLYHIQGREDDAENLLEPYGFFM